MRLGFSASGTAGAVAVLGSLLIFATAPAQVGTVASYQKISNTQGNFSALLDNLDEFGGAVTSLGDLDGPGPSVAAVAVGVIGDDDGGGNRGAVYILFLDSAKRVLSYTKISSTQGNFSGPLDNADEFGSSVAGLGDLDGAGPSVAALAVGAVGDDDGGLSRGAVYILFLSSAGTVLSSQKISDTQGNFTAVIDTADEFGGAAVGLGDLDGPGPSVAALAVGAIGDDDGGTDRGAVYVLFLNNAGLVLSYQKISDTAGNFTATLDNSDEFGSSVGSLGDLDGPYPSVAALAVGATFDDDGGTDRGAVYVLFLDNTGTVLSHQKISDTVGGFTATIDNLDEFGSSVAGLGNLDGLGASVGALAASAIGDDDGGIDRGAVYVLFLNNAGLVLSYQKISDTAGNFTATIDDGDDFGAGVAALEAHDVPGSTARTLVVGAPGDDDGGGGRGAIYGLTLVTPPSTDVVLPGAPAYVLGRACPNPFNPSTTIPFRVGAAARLQINILDATGRLVRGLVHERVVPGEYTAAWDGLDDSGRPVASGTYFYRMSVDGRPVGAAEKAILLK